MKENRKKLPSKRCGKTIADANMGAEVRGSSEIPLPLGSPNNDVLGAWHAAVANIPAESRKIIVDSMAVLPQLPDQGDLSDSVHATFVQARKQAGPELAEILDFITPEVVKKPLSERSTDELIIQIDAGRFPSEIARSWSVPASDLNNWILADADRFMRAKLARKNQAALWDLVAFQVLLHAPCDRLEIARAEKIARHCRWRAEAFSRDDYGRNIKVARLEEPNARELTTCELEVIARGGVPPG